MIGDLASFHRIATSFARDQELLLDPSRPIFYGRAPGRLDIIGGIADYSGSLVLEMPIAEGTYVAAQPSTTDIVDVVSLDSDLVGFRHFTLSIDDVNSWQYESAAASFQAQSRDHWAAYCLGVIVALRLERGVKTDKGFQILIGSDVPEAKGVSSSAALELATFHAFCEMTGNSFTAADASRMCQIAENRVAQAPCGIMDQMTVACGQKDTLLLLSCRPAEILGHLQIPTGLRLWGIDSGVRHAVSGSSYHDVRVGAFMGLSVVKSLPGRERTRYLTDLDPESFQSLTADLPDVMKGETFLARFGSWIDSATTVDASTTYAVRTPSGHPVYENDRVARFAALLGEYDAGGRGKATDLGALLYASHDSYSECGLGTPETDLIVDLVRDEGEVSGLYGARISGGGSGGTVVVLGSASAGESIGRVADRFGDMTGHAPYIFSGSSNGVYAGL